MNGNNSNLKGRYLLCKIQFFYHPDLFLGMDMIVQDLGMDMIVQDFSHKHIDKICECWG